ncbi:hypothetical protein [Brevibacterium sp. 2SA]|uniref:hypothetical protein n=1 Tax=Brevibacterium sp. 2SA TaxID=2502198 RepID=UPI0010F49C3B|nr:hypothetical protein [Brevibacterium sp. 2SA]
MIEITTPTKPRMRPVRVRPLLFACPFLIAERPMKPKMIAATAKRKPMPNTKPRTTPTMPPMSARMPQMFFEVLLPDPDE